MQKIFEYQWWQNLLLSGCLYLKTFDYISRWASVPWHYTENTAVCVIELEHGQVLSNERTIVHMLSAMTLYLGHRNTNLYVVMNDSFSFSSPYTRPNLSWENNYHLPRLRLLRGTCYLNSLFNLSNVRHQQTCHPWPSSTHWSPASSWVWNRRLEDVQHHKQRAIQWSMEGPAQWLGGCCQNIHSTL